MFKLKPLHANAIASAVEKAHRYRLLNEPGEAESICLDVLEVEPENQEARVTLLLALTDQFTKGLGDRLAKARAALDRLTGDYEKAYYAGVIAERRAKAIMRSNRPGTGFDAYDGMTEAMEWYEKADALRHPGNDDAALRWNACARKIMNNPELRPRTADAYVPDFEE